jgi:hypothetical protein
MGRDVRSKTHAQSLHFKLQMTTDELLQHLKELELALHQPAVRRDAARMDELYMSPLPSSDAPDGAITEAIFWKCFGMKSRQDRFGLKTSRWPK